jgi:hypothetical protein
MNTTLTVERLRELRELLQPVTGRRVDCGPEDVRAARDLVTLIDAHLSPSAELGETKVRPPLHIEGVSGTPPPPADVRWTDDELRALWRDHGGSFHGPNVETGTMPEADLLPLLRGLQQSREPPADMPPACETCGGKGGSGYATTGNLAWDRCPKCHSLGKQPPADVQAVVEGLRKVRRWMGDTNGYNAELDRAIEYCQRVTASLEQLVSHIDSDCPARECRLPCHVLDKARAITFLQQRPLSEELRQAMLAGANYMKQISTQYYPNGSETKAKLDAQVALLTRAAEGKEKP